MKKLTIKKKSYTHKKLPKATKGAIIKLSPKETIINNKKQNMLLKVLKFLSGKKNILAGLITTTSAFLAFKGLISPEDATYINAISLILFGSASIATGKLVYKK